MPRQSSHPFSIPSSTQSRQGHYQTAVRLAVLILLNSVHSRPIQAQVRPALAAHDDFVTRIMCVKDVMYSAGADGRIKTWALSNAELIGDDKSHKSAVCAIALDRDDQHLISADSTGLIMRRNLSSSESVPFKKLHTAAVICLVMSADSFVYSGGADGQVIGWNSATGEVQAAYIANPKSPIEAMSLSADGSELAVALSDENVKHLSVPGLKFKRTLKPQSDPALKGCFESWLLLENGSELLTWPICKGASYIARTNLKHGTTSVAGPIPGLVTCCTPKHDLSVYLLGTLDGNVYVVRSDLTAFSHVVKLKECITALDAYIEADGSGSPVACIGTETGKIEFHELGDQKSK